MKTKYKHIYFEAVAGSTDPCYTLHNNKTDACMGFIRYYKPWKKHEIEFEENCGFDESCLRDIADFLDQLNKEKRPK